MEDERKDEEVEAHRFANDPEHLKPGAEQAADSDADDDEVEAHVRREQHTWGPETRRE